MEMSDLQCFAVFTVILFTGTILIAGFTDRQLSKFDDVIRDL